MSEAQGGTSGRIAWFEIPADDSARARKFYSGLLGWEFEDSGGQDYHMTTAAGGAIYGAPGQRGLVTYFSVEDIESTIQRVRDLGGEAGEKQEVPGFAFYSVCTDTEGNSFGLFEYQTS